MRTVSGARPVLSTHRSNNGIHAPNRSRTVPPAPSSRTLRSPGQARAIRFIRQTSGHEVETFAATVEAGLRL